MPRVVHFEIPADDPERALRFYENAFGWTAQKWDGPQEYWALITGKDGEPGINGGVMPRQAPDHPACNTINVDDVAAATAKVTAAGGQVILPKMTVPSVGYLAYCKDTEGNVFGVMQIDPNATS